MTDVVSNETICRRRAYFEAQQVIDCPVVTDEIIKSARSAVRLYRVSGAEFDQRMRNFETELERWPAPR